MAKEIGRRKILQGSAAYAGLAALGLPGWALPALTQDETLIPFTDIPGNFNTNPSAQVRFLDIRRINGQFTPIDQFFTNVMVLADAPAVRANRLALLNQLSKLFLAIADISMLQSAE